jgi:hypothetical protein
MERAGAWVVVAIAVAIIAAVAYFGWKGMDPALPPHVAAPAAPEAAAPPAQPETTPERYPIRPEQNPAQTAREGAAGLWDAVAGLFADESLAALLNREDFVQRVVATVDNLPRRKLPQRLMPVKPPGGPLLVIEQADSAVISPANAARYERYMRLVQAVDTGRLIAVYVHYYPLFQQAFRDLGYPNGYFNDRVVEVIDDLLAAPEPPKAAKLNRPKVFYVFDDPALESLSAGQKMLIRVGPLNAATVKAKLREVRKALVGQAVRQ